VFQNAATYLTKAQIAGATVSIGLPAGQSRSTAVLNLKVQTKPSSFPDITIGSSVTAGALQNALQYYMGGPTGGVALLAIDSQYNPVAAVWSQTEASTVVGAYPIARTVSQNQTTPVSISVANADGLLKLAQGITT
jgi:hypothetical protein